MHVVGMYSVKHGQEFIKRLHFMKWEEVFQVIAAVDAERCKISADPGQEFYDPRCVKEAFKSQFSIRGWQNQRINVEYPTGYYVSGYTPRSSNQESTHFREMDFVKQRLGVGVQAGRYASMVYDVCAKMTIFAKMGVIDCGIEIVSMQALADEMPAGVPYFEQFVWDLEHRGVSDIDIPVLILGIDTDGMKPKDLKIAEAQQPYLLFED